MEAEHELTDLLEQGKKWIALLFSTPFRKTDLVTRGGKAAVKEAWYLLVKTNGSMLGSPK